MKSYEKDDTLIFLHIPKAAGTTFNKIIDRQFNTKAVFANNKIVRAKLGNDWMQYDPIQREELAKNQLQSLTAEERNKIQLLRGHMEFGWHDCFENNCTYITFLREPVERVISQFYYIKRLKGHKLEQIITKENLSLSEFVERGLSVVTDNGMTRKIAGLSDSVGFQEYDESLLDTAKENIDKHFGFVGISEQFDKSLMILSDFLGWKNVQYYNQNVTVNRRKAQSIDELEIDKVRRHIQLDIELYDFALKSFNATYERRKEFYDGKLKKFESSNAVYQKTQGVKEYLKKKLKFN